MEFSSYEMELQNWVTQNGVTLRVANSKIFIKIAILSHRISKYQIKLRGSNSKFKLLIFYFRVTNSKLKNKKLHFELLTRRLNFFFHFWVTNWKLKNKKLHSELLTCSWNIINFTLSYQLDGLTLIFLLSSY